ncbi:MAG: chromosome segregation SMC family protein [Thermoleophilia bacterium]
MLSRLTVRGFKSFADGTTLDMGPGINVVVGPNGSGKSNLAEAVIWALGEQRAGRLRAGGMADVLYSGGDRRPAAQYAEVGLLLSGDEAGDRGPAEVESRRRLTRAGDADYRLNGESCRLLDVQEALARRGIGPDALAVIRQGQVEALCTSTPVERRAIVDAAAGVAVAKRRRRRAEQKLARVADKLDRARDLAGEVRSRARALERQARAAERAKTLEDDIVRARRAAGAARARAAAAAHAAAQAEAERLAAVAAADRTALDAARAERAAAAAARAAAGAEEARARDLATALRTAADRTAGRAELAAERVAAAERRAGEALERRRAAAERLGALQEAADAAAEATEVATRRAGETDRIAAEAEEHDRAARAEHRRLEDASAAASAALLAARREAEALGRRLEAARSAATAAAARLAQQPGAGDVPDLARAERREEIAAGRAVRWAERARAAEAAAADADAARDVAETRAREARVAARALAPADDGRAGRAAGLGDGLEVAEGAEHAVAAALGALAEAVPAASVDDARAALDAGADWAAVPAPSRPAGSGPPGGRRLLDLVTGCADAARPHVERLLADAWLVDDLTTVPTGMTGVAVTADGVALRPADGLVTRSSGSWARRALHGRAEEAERTAAAALDGAAAAAGAARTALERTARRRRAADRAATRASEALARARAQAAARAARAVEARAEAERSEAERLAAEAAQAQGAPAVAAAESEARAAVELAVAAREAADAAQAAARAAASEAADARAELAAARAHAAEADARLASTRAVADDAAAAPDLEPHRRVAQALDGAAAALLPAAERAAAQLGEAVEAARGVEGAVAAADRAVEGAERVAGQSASAVHAAEVEAAVAAERAAEAGPPPADDEELPDPEAAAVELAELERRREVIGAVNPLAAAERDELSERETDMAAQITDLEEAGERLRTHLAELDAAVAEGFDSLFDAFRDRFTEVCGLLFPGGEGRLRAVVGDDGEAGIEVEVVPAGKRPRSLSLMSGGERSLVALAFCMALAMARPAPFYLLDEVEAALDDVNLRRFLGVVKRLAERTQFVLITHQQPTVEIADTIFGVTMGAEGVSQIVARRLKRDVEGPARPYVRRALHAIPGGLSG